MGKSKEFDREGDAEVDKVVTKTAPLGLLPIMYIAISILIILGVALWWATS